MSSLVDQQVREAATAVEAASSHWPRHGGSSAAARDPANDSPMVSRSPASLRRVARVVARSLAVLCGGWLACAAPVAAQLPAPLPQPSLDLRAGAQARVAVATPDGGAIIGHFGRWVGGDLERAFLLRIDAAGNPVSNWPVDVNGSVAGITIEGDDVYLAGSFSTVNGTARRGLARVSLSTGALSPWDPNAGSNSQYRFDSLAVVGDAVYVGGFFTQVGTSPRTLVAKIDRNSGVLDPAFALTATALIGADVAVRSDGSALFVGGAFNTVNGATRRNVVKLSLVDGSVDPAWEPPFNSQVLRLAVDGGFLYATGCFSQVAGIQRNFVARVSTTGTGALDATWNPAPNGGCTYALDIDANHVYVGGAFTQMGGGAAQRVGRVAKTGTGALDTSWQPALDGIFAYGSVPRADGSVLVVGDFISVGSAYSPGIVRTSASGAPQASNPYIEQRGFVSALAAAPDGGTYVGGPFHRIGPLLRRGVLRLSPSGALDTAWAPALAGRGNVRSLARDANHLYIGGELSTAGTPTAFNLIRVSHAGAVDAAWTPNPAGPVAAMAIDEAANTIVIGGSFTLVAGQPRNRLAEINRSTAQVTAFNPNVGANTVFALALVGNDVFIAGDFTSVGGIARSRLAKLSRTGTVDPGFVADANNSVLALFPGPNGTIYAGGFFSNISGLGRQGLVRLSQANGAPDPLWTTFANGIVYAIAPTADGIQVGGSFSVLGDQPRRNLARVTHANQIAPLFAPTPDSTVFAVLEQGSRLLAGGLLGFNAPTTQRQVGVLAYPRDATPVATTLTITSDQPENTQPFQFYRVEVSATGGGVPLANQRVFVECDSGASCEAILDASGNGSCELASRTPGTRTLTARFAGTPLFLAATDTEPHNVAGIAATPPANPSFALRSPGFVDVVARTGTGDLLIGGTFNRIGDTLRRNLARLQSDGSLDPALSADVIGVVGGIAVDPAGDAYIVGSFSNIDGTFRRNIAKVDSAGNVVPSWIPARTDPGSGVAHVDGAGNLILQGPTFNVSGSPNFFRTSLFKLDGTNGALLPDLAVEITTANTGFFPFVGVVGDGSWLYLFGRFDTVNGVARRNLARISATGVVDTTWNPSPDNLVNDIEPDGTGGVYIAGGFTEIAGQTALARLVRLDATGAVVPAFAPLPDSTVSLLSREGSVLHAVGSFTAIGGISRTFLAKIDASTGAADAGFAQLDTTLFPTTFERLGNALWIPTGGFQVSASEPVSMGAVRVDPTSGQQLPTSTVSRPAIVYALARQPDGATLVGGYFARATGGQRNLVRITPSGQFDTSFAPLLDPATFVRALLVRGNGDIYVGSGGLRKLSPTGEIDPAFATTSGGSVRALRDAGDGLIAGGFFTSAGAPAVTRNRIAKLDYATGQPFSGWNPNADGSVNALALGPAGEIYLGGGFTSIGGVTRQRLAKLNGDGSLDTSWQPQANSTVSALLVDGGNVYAGGSFSTASGAPRRSLARFDASTGALSNWAPGGVGPGVVTGSSSVFALAKAQDGGILAGGSFRVLGGAYRSNAGKVDPVTGVADALWNPSLDTPVYALLAGYGNTPARSPLGAIEQNIAIGGEFEFQGAAPMPGFVAVPSVGQPTTDGVFCDGFETAACAPAP